MKSLIFSILFLCFAFGASATERDSVAIADSLLYLDASPTENVRVERVPPCQDTTVAFIAAANIGRD